MAIKPNEPTTPTAGNPLAGEETAATPPKPGPPPANVPTLDKGEEPAAEMTMEQAVAEAEKWRALAKKHETRSKENYEKAQELDQIKDAERTEIERIQNQVAEWQAKAEAAEKKVVLSEVADEYDIPASHRILLNGDNREQLEAQAAIIKKSLGDTPSAPSSTGQGDIGGHSPSKPVQATAAEVDRMTPDEHRTALEEGRLADYLQN